MPAYTLEELREELEKVRAALSTVSSSGQAYTAGGPGQDMALSRAQYLALHEREKWLVGQIESLEALESDGTTHLVQFWRPR
jgi:hypothetical protein